MHLDDDATVIQRILDHIDAGTTDLGEGVWREPVANYRSTERFAAEREQVLRRYAIPFCPSAQLDRPGSYVARDAAGTPLLAVRGQDGRVRAFRNACRHRGTQVAAGAGCGKSFVCRYHGWTYALDGTLRHVPHEHGFPGLDKADRGLVPVEAVEKSGLVFVTQDAPAVANAQLDALPPVIPDTFRFVGFDEREVEANWKVFAESFLEGYHIRTTHEQTFFAVQFDNLNVIETFGRNNRIAFPFRSVHKCRSMPPGERSADGRLTYVYHLFPNAVIATFPGRIVVAILEPVAVDRTRLLSWYLTDRDPSDAGQQEMLERGADLVSAGAAEDREMVGAIQRSIGSGANEFFEFGRFEGAIGRFHRELHAMLGEDAGG